MAQNFIAQKQVRKGSIIDRLQMENKKNYDSNFIWYWERLEEDTACRGSEAEKMWFWDI